MMNLKLGCYCRMAKLRKPMRVFGVSLLLVAALSGCGLAAKNWSENNLEPSAALASKEQVQTAQQFRPIAGRANVYIKLNHDESYTVNKVEVDGVRAGVLHGGQYLNFTTNPGHINLKLITAVSGATTQPAFLFADFDLEVSTESIVLIECKSSKYVGYTGPGVSINERPKGAPLRNFSACARSDLNEKRGTTACETPYSNEKNFTFDSATWDKKKPFAQCFLVSEAKSFAEAVLVKPERSHISNFDSALKKAKQINTITAYQALKLEYPNSSKLTALDPLVALIEQDEAKKARKQQILERLKRDSNLPLQAQKDKYMLALKDLLTKQEFERSLFYFELLDAMNVQLSPSINFFWAEALLNTGKPKQAMEKLYAYINAEGAAGQFYERALMLLTEAEEQM